MKRGVADEEKRFSHVGGEDNSSEEEYFEVGGVAECLMPIRKQLNSLLEDIKNFSGDGHELARLQGMVNAIDKQRVNGAFFGASTDPTGGSMIPPGQAELHDILHRCYCHLDEKKYQLDNADADVSPKLLPIKKELESILRQLEKAKSHPELLPHAQGRIDAIDSQRVDGVFGGTSVITPGQGVLNNLLFEGYNKIYSIQCKHAANDAQAYRRRSQQIDSKLRPFFNELQSILHALEEFHGDSEALRHIQGRIVAIDRQRVDGCFLGESKGQEAERGERNEIPTGQSILHEAMLNCYAQCHLKLELLDAREKHIHPKLVPIRKELDYLLRDLQIAKADPTKLPNVQGRLFQLDSKRKYGMFVPEHCDLPPHSLPGQAALHDALHEAYSLVHRIQMSQA